MKKKLLMAISYVLILALGVMGTVAYFTDRDAEVNVFTVGNVDIELNETFEQGAELLPGKDVTKEATITNTGANKAWVWATVAIPAALDDTGNASKNIIHFNYSKESVEAGNWTWQDADGEWMISTMEKDGIEYNVYAVLHTTPLASGAVTLPFMTKVYMDTRVDMTSEGDLYWVENGATQDLDWNVNADKQGAPLIYVAAYAIQIDTVESVYDGYEKYGTQWGGNNNAEYPDPESVFADTWDGTADTSWYNDTDTTFTLTSAEQLAGLAELVDGGNTFEGKTITLDKDMDLYAEDEDGNRIQFNPIGHSANGKSFNGTFDGQGNTVSGMYQQSNLDSNNGGWKYEGQYYGLFAYTKGAEIKNVTIADAYVSSGRNEAACVVGNAEDTAFSNITISNSTLIAYNNSAGGVASECYGNCSFTNITVDEDTVIGPLWGTYDVRLGGVVGLVHAENNVTFKDVTVSCKLDAINDVAANYQYWLYRYSGMLIGHVDGVNGVADPTGYVTCENVVVNYGDWVNYHYCEDADLGAGSYNGPGEYKYARVEAGTGTDGIDLSACNHNADESHNVLIVFDQLFGGGQGIRGLETYPGVTVNYNN